MKRMSLLLIVLLAYDAYAAKPRQAPAIPQAPQSTLCACADTGKCICWAGQCTCEACKPAKAVPAKRPFSSTTQRTPVQAADTRPQLVQAPGSSEGTPRTGIYTLAPSAAPLGSTSGCANGQCSSPSFSRRRR